VANSDYAFMKPPKVKNWNWILMYEKQANHRGNHMVMYIESSMITISHDRLLQLVKEQDEELQKPEAPEPPARGGDL
jgi:hypothetical protein